MALLKCPDCGHNVSDQAEMCSGCGYPVSKIKEATLNEQEEIEYTPLSQQDDEKLKKWKSDSSGGIMAFVFLAIIILGGLYFIGAFDSPYKFTPPPASKTAQKQVYEVRTGTEGEAYSFAKRFVQERLKAPRTAKFPGMSEAQIRKVDGTFIVSSYVDSQNVFGAMVRTHYRAKVIYLGDLTWKLLDLQTE